MTEHEHTYRELRTNSRIVRCSCGDMYQQPSPEQMSRTPIKGARNLSVMEQYRALSIEQAYVSGS